MAWFSHPKSLIVGIYFSNSAWKNSWGVSVLPSTISIVRDKETSFFYKSIPTSFMLPYNIIKTSWLIRGYDDRFVIIEIYIWQRIGIHRIIGNSENIKLFYVSIGIPRKIILNKEDFVVIKNNIRSAHFWNKVLNPRGSSRTLSSCVFNFNIYILFFLRDYRLVVNRRTNRRWYVAQYSFCWYRWQGSKKSNTYKKYYHWCDGHGGISSEKRVNHKKDIKNSTSHYTTNY